MFELLYGALRFRWVEVSGAHRPQLLLVNKIIKTVKRLGRFRLATRKFFFDCACKFWLERAILCSAANTELTGMSRPVRGTCDFCQFH